MQTQSDKKTLVLIVDDIVVNIQILAKTLDKEGYAIEAALSGEQAIEKAITLLPDLILLDVMMPEMDGYQVCQKLKEREDTKDIPIIFVTAKDQSTNIQKGFEVGAADYVSKPFVAQELLKRVHVHIILKKQREELERTSLDRKELIHVLCHDLLNPVTGIHERLKLLETCEEFFDSRQKLLDTSHNALETIRLVRKMVVTEEQELSLTYQNLKTMIRQSESILQPMLERKDIKLEVSVDEKIEVFTEKVSFVNSVLNNLLTNAVKFSYPSSKVKIFTRQEELGRVNVCIQDEGLGIPEHIKENLFVIQKHSVGKGTKGEKGLGFGLNLVKKFIDLYDGKIEVYSETKENSHGTEVVVTLKAK